MRVLLFTGKGGVGKTTTAAATAAVAASRGRRVLVISTDPSHSLADALGVPLGAGPTEVGPGLHAMQVDTQAAFERSWADVRHYLRSVLASAGVDEVQAEELTVLPGAEEVLALVELRAQAESGRWDLVVVDCAPTGETLRLLALPEALAWYVERVFPAQRRALRAVRPLLSRVGGAPVPGDGVLAAVEQLHAELSRVRALLTAESTSVRIVLTPEAVVVAEARRTLTSLALYGYRVDGLVANRVFPAPAAAAREPFLAGWAASQAEQLAVVRADAGGLPVREQEYRSAEPVGLVALTAVGEALYGDDDPVGAPPAAHELMTVRRDGDDFVLEVALPLVRREDVALARTGDELALTIAGHRRLLALPSVLRRCDVAGAQLTPGRLELRFVVDPEQWPEALLGGNAASGPPDRPVAPTSHLSPAALAGAR